jgi:hypothetical protein
MRFIKQDPDAQVIRPATVQAMAAGISNTEDVACTGKYVMLVNAVNGGNDLRYQTVSDLGEDVVDALREDGFAFRIVEPARFEELMGILAYNLEDEGLLEIEVRAFHFGSLVAFYETIV